MTVKTNEMVEPKVDHADQLQVSDKHSPATTTAAEVPVAEPPVSENVDSTEKTTSTDKAEDAAAGLPDSSSDGGLSENQKKYDLHTIIEEKGALKKFGAWDFTLLSDDEMIWNASIVLLNYLEKLQKNGSVDFRGKKILELGSGLGHLGFAMKTRLGADVVCTERGGKWMKWLKVRS